MKAAPSDQKLLLDLQGVDSALDRLAFQRRTHASLALIEAATARLARLRDDKVVAETVLADLALEQRRLDQDVDAVRARHARNDKLLAGGTLGAKDLQGIEHEQGSLLRRQGVLEDELLEVMERVETAEARRNAVLAETTQVAGDLQAAMDSRDAAWALLDSEAGLLGADRNRLAGLVPLELETLYEKLRTGNRGVGAALLTQRKCQGCHMELTGADLRDVRAAAEDDVIRCPECTKVVLIRTEVSGL